MLIFGIILGMVNSVTAQSKETTQTEEQTETISPKNINKNNQIDNSIQTNEKSIGNKQKNNSNLVNKQNSSPSKPLPPKNVDEASTTKKSFPIKDSLIFIDLPIVIILLLLWFLNRN